MNCIYCDKVATKIGRISNRVHGLCAYHDERLGDDYDMVEPVSDRDTIPPEPETLRCLPLVIDVVEIDEGWQGENTTEVQRVS